MGNITDWIVRQVPNSSCNLKKLNKCCGCSPKTVQAMSCMPAVASTGSWFRDSTVNKLAMFATNTAGEHCWDVLITDVGVHRGPVSDSWSGYQHRTLCHWFSAAHSALNYTMFNGPFPGLPTQVTRYQKGKTNLDFTEARDSEWQWHQLGHMQVCTSLQTDNHACTPPLSFLQAGCFFCFPTNSVKALTWQHLALDLPLIHLFSLPVGLANW